MLGFVGCAPQPPAIERSPSGLMESSARDVPDVDAAVEAWNERARSVDTLYGRGIFQLNWIDADGGRHADQGDIDLWYERPDRIAIRCSKFGDTISLFGSDGRMQWFYDATEDVFYEGEIVPGQMLLIADQPFSPSLLLDVLGLRPVPAGRWRIVSSPEQQESQGGRPELYGARPPVGEQGDRSGPELWWWFEEDGVDWPVSRTYALLDDRIMEVEDDPGRRRTVRIPDRPVTAWPRLAGSITMQMRAADGREELNSSQMAFDELTVDVAGEPMDRVFDLDQLLEALQPAEVRQLRPDDDAGASM